MIRRLVALLLLLALAGCAVGPDFVRPKAPKVAGYLRGKPATQTAQAGGVSQRFQPGVKIPIAWWRMFNTTKIDPVIQHALSNSPTVQAATATLREAEENLAAGEGVYYPELNASFGATREKSNPKSFGVNVSPSVFNLFTLSGSVSYALDLFGGARREAEGLKALVNQQQYALLAAYLTLTTNLVNAVIARAAYEDEIQATSALILDEKAEVTLTQTNVKSGTAPYSTLLALQSQLAATQATLPALKQHLDQTDHLLATLSGETPANFAPPPIALTDLTLPADLPESLPSQLVRHRPDILEAEATLHAASAQIGVATAALYPSLSLNGSFGVISTSPHNLLSSESSLWNLGANLLAPIFHGGTLRAQKQAAVEAFKASLAAYRQTVLQSFEQVADALRGLDHDAELVRSQSQALQAAQEEVRLLRANYRAGTAGYLQLLTAQAQYSQAKLGSVQAQGQRMEDTVALFAALGGSWANRPSGAARHR